MTRINLGIDPQLLTSQHLLAEHREMKRIPNMVRTGRANLSNIPSTFRLGLGHVSFFYDKLGTLLERYKAVHRECLRRGFKVSNYVSAWDGLPIALMGYYRPRQEDVKEVLNRLVSKDERYLTVIS